MRLLFLCNTLYQVIVASCIRDMYPNDTAELILSDHSVANERIAARFTSNGKIFSKVYYVETKYLYDHDESLSRFKRLKSIRNSESVIKTVGYDQHFDMFFCANSDPFSRRVANYVLRFNRQAVINWFEDGITAYNFDKKYFADSTDGIRRILKAIAGVRSVTDCISNYFVFLPQNMEWIPPAELKRITPMKAEMAAALGEIFNFADCCDRYSEKYIFFEDGAMDWSTGADVALVKQIAEIVGKENVFVKRHPRDPENRFEPLGVRTSRDSSIPWEIIASSIDIEDKVLITMYSQCVVTPEILLGRKCKCLVLGEMDGFADKTGKEVYEYVERHFFAKDPSTYLIPKNISELMEMLAKMKDTE